MRFFLLILLLFPHSVNAEKYEDFSDMCEIFATCSKYSELLGKYKLDDFLHAIMMIESSGGKNTKHPVIIFGIHKGERAYGKWGLMPNTINEISRWVNNSKSLLRKEIGNKIFDPVISSLYKLPYKQVKKILKNDSRIELRLVRYLSTRLYRIHKGNYLKMAAAWYFGTNMRKIPLKYMKSDYVIKFSIYLWEYRENLNLSSSGNWSKTYSRKEHGWENF